MCGRTGSRLTVTRASASFISAPFWLWLLSATLVMTTSTSCAFTAYAFVPSSYTAGHRVDRPNVCDPRASITTTRTTTQLYAETARRPWEFLRFVRQSSQFVRAPWAGTPAPVTVTPGETLWRAGDSSSSLTLGPLDDVVMGGASSSTFDGTTGIWSGEVTTANQGGFVGLRSAGVTWDCTTCTGLEWKVKHTQKGGARRYKFVMRDSTDFNGITWTTSVDVAPGAVTTVRLPFDQQIPALFARRVDDAADFDRSRVAAVQVAFSKFEYNGDLNPTFVSGPFKLQLLELATY